MCTPDLLFGIHAVSWDEVVHKIAALEGRGKDAHETWVCHPWALSLGVWAMSAQS